MAVNDLYIHKDMFRQCIYIHLYFKCFCSMLQLQITLLSSKVMLNSVHFYSSNFLRTSPNIITKNDIKQSNISNVYYVQYKRPRNCTVVLLFESLQYIYSLVRICLFSFCFCPFTT